MKKPLQAPDVLSIYPIMLEMTREHVYLSFWRHL